MRTRPLVVNKFREYVGDRSVTIQSKRLLEEMKVFIWKSGRPEAQTGYNDDLVMSFGIGQFLRDTSLKFQQQGLDMTRAALNSMQVNRPTHQGAYFSKGKDNPYHFKAGNENIDLKGWL
jgi:hypothetical protein